MKAIPYLIGGALGAAGAFVVLAASDRSSSLGDVLRKVQKAIRPKAVDTW